MALSLLEAMMEMLAVREQAQLSHGQRDGNGPV